MSSLPGAVREAVTAIADVFARGARTARSRRLGRAGTVMAALWTIGILTDAVSTVWMMRSGLFEEANAVAAAGMSVLGVEGYVLVASLVCCVLAVPTLSRPPRNLYAVTTWVGLAVIAVAKVYVGASNVDLALA